jgi:hypothetical protein
MIIEWKDSIPTLFGYPLWYGNIKRRVAKKYINRRSIGYINKYSGEKFRQLDIGDMINSCSGLNSTIKEIDPCYINYAGGKVLVDIDFTTSSGGCSLTSCGVSAAKSQQEVEKNWLVFANYWLNSGAGAIYYGGLDNPKYQDQINLIRRKVNVLQNGGHIADDLGVLLDNFR